MSEVSDATDSDLYRRCMERLRRRVASIQGILSGSANTGALITDVEFMNLQLRKILEGIALAGICAYREQYERARAEIWKDWNARYILRDIERLVPHFYPIPLELEDGRPDPETGIRPLLKKTSGFLEKPEFLDLYTRTARRLHEDNPFAGLAQSDLQHEYDGFHDTIRRVIQLLNKHELHPKPRVMWVVQMNVHPGGNVKVSEWRRGGRAAPPTAV